MDEQGPLPVTRTKLLVVEGKDEEMFAGAMLRHLGIADVDIRSVGGKDQFKVKLPLLVKISGFENVNMVGVLRDAEDSFDGTLQSMNEVLNAIGFDRVDAANTFTTGQTRVGVFITPDNGNPGMLETLCLRALESSPAIGCIEDFFSCVSKLETPPNNQDKTKMQAYLASLPKDVRSLGISAQKGCWDFNNEAFASLRGFLESFK